MNALTSRQGIFLFTANREFHYNRGSRKGREPCPKQTARWAPRRSGKLVLQLAIPAMLAQFVNILYSVVDRMYVGHIAGAGDAALAGVGVCAPVVTMITAIGALIGFGGGPLMSIRMGRRDMDGARQIITNSFYLLLALSVLATVPLLIFKRQILFTFGCSELLWDYAQAYFTTYVSGTVFALLSYGLNQITMSQGFSGYRNAVGYARSGRKYRT